MTDTLTRTEDPPATDTGTGRCRHCHQPVTGPDSAWTIHIHDHCPRAHAAIGSPPRPNCIPPPAPHPATRDTLTAIPGHAWKHPGVLAAYLREAADELDGVAHRAMLAAAGS